ncbi:MAG: hypothetical protein P8Y23_02755 [Candidatus Lokiarchaeota archaeon]|jgi:hypothetical protein
MSENVQEKNKEFNEFINKPVDINNSAYYSYFISFLKGEVFGTEIPDAKYSLFEEKFIAILNELSKIEDDDWKFDSYSYFLYSIKITRLLEENITHIFNSLDTTEDDCEKRNLFDRVVETIQEAGLLEKNFHIILQALEKITDEIERQFGFEFLLYFIRETPLLDENFKATLNTIFNFRDDEVVRSAFYTLTSTLGETQLSSENFGVLLSSLDKLSVVNKLLTFSDIITTLRVSDLPKEQKQAKFSLISNKFPDILKVISNIDDENNKRYNICHLLFSIRKTIFLEENFLAILNIIDTIRNLAYKRANISNVISTIKEEEEKSFNEKLKLIKERFPEYSDDIVKALKNEKDT